jgi:hypothetical protein
MALHFLERGQAINLNFDVATLIFKAVNYLEILYIL